MLKEQFFQMAAKVYPAFVLCAALLLSGCADFVPVKKNVPRNAQVNSETANGVYEGEAAGYRGVIRVRVRVEEGAIAEVHIIESSEDKAVGGAAMEELLDLVLAYNTTSLDAVSGATESSRGILAAVENALGSAE